MKRYEITVTIELDKTYVVHANNLIEAQSRAEVEACNQLNAIIQKSDFNVSAVNANKDWDEMDKEEIEL
jgi:hypothetical protein